MITHVQDHKLTNTAETSASSVRQIQMKLFMLVPSQDRGKKITEVVHESGNPSWKVQLGDIITIPVA